MANQESSSLIGVSACGLFALVLTACPTNDNVLGLSQPDAGSPDGSPAVTCEVDGKTYQVGESVVRSPCTTCVCQANGTVGLCTGLCPPDGGEKMDVAPVGGICQQNGETYQIGETVVVSDCTTCVCQADGVLGRCTGLCPPDAGTKVDGPVKPDAIGACQQGGKSYQVGETVVVSDCTTCICQADGVLGRCTGLCPPDAGTKVDGPVKPDAIGACQQGGRSYQLGDIVRVNDCTTCVCEADGVLGHCTGACPPDAQSAADGPSTLCSATGGTISAAQCCQSAGDFPNTCLDGVCGCSVTNSHAVSTCSCPSGACFDPSRGCVGRPNVCTPGADQTCNSNSVISATRGRCQSDGSCVCLPDYTLQPDGKCN